MPPPERFETFPSTLTRSSLAKVSYFQIEENMLVLVKDSKPYIHHQIQDKESYFWMSEDLFAK